MRTARNKNNYANKTARAARSEYLKISFNCGYLSQKLLIVTYRVKLYVSVADHFFFFVWS